LQYPLSNAHLLPTPFIPNNSPGIAYDYGIIGDVLDDDGSCTDGSPFTDGDPLNDTGSYAHMDSFFDGDISG
jgi:hypothetical protein